MKILTINNKKEEKVLRTRVGYFDFEKTGEKKIGEIIKKMKEVMLGANGLGLSANQVGLSARLFVALIPDEENNTGKFYAIFNPEITKFSKKKSVMEEGCLSVPGVYGSVERPEKIALSGQDENGKKIKIQIGGLAARVFQHETDHLNGILFIDKAAKIHLAA